MKRYLYIWLLLAVCCTAAAERQYADSAVWQGMNVKLDVGNTIFTLARSHARTQQYEVAVNANFLNHFYPTVELGYGLSKDVAGGGRYEGQGAFTRLGIDINPLRKGRNRYYALLAGLRFGMDLQQFALFDVNLHDDYWSPGGVMRDYPARFRFDCWGELVAGMQIQVVGPLTMGWYARVRFLFTEKAGDHQPYFIPGYGCIDGPTFGFNYYIGWRI